MLLNIHKNFGENALFSLNATLGASIEDYFYRGLSIGGDLKRVANLFTFSNLLTGKAFNKDTFRDQTQSVFGTLNLGFKNFLFLEATAREDWASQMAGPDGVQPFFYPSVGGSWLITEMFDRKSDFIPYAKLRASYAEVGNPIERFILNKTYALDANGTPGRNTWGTARASSPSEPVPGKWVPTCVCSRANFSFQGLTIIPLLPTRCSARPTPPSLAPACTM